jgi:hypothetical protein
MATKIYSVGPVEIPPCETMIQPDGREFLRLPRVGQRCPVTGLSRATLNAWILPSAANGFKPPVKSFVIRQPGSKTGVRIISYPHLRAFILAHADNPNTPTESAAHAE